MPLQAHLHVGVNGLKFERTGDWNVKERKNGPTTAFHLLMASVAKSESAWAYRTIIESFRRCALFPHASPF